MVPTLTVLAVRLACCCRPLEETVPSSLGQQISGDYYSAELGTHYTITTVRCASQLHGWPLCVNCPGLLRFFVRERVCTAHHTRDRNQQSYQIIHDIRY
jgi:hypothetical protein